MKNKYAFLLALLLGASTAQAQFRLPNVGARLQNAVNDRLSRRTDEAINQGLDKTESTAKGATKGTTSAPAPVTSNTSSTASTKASGATGDVPTSNNYDFVPGTTPLFEDEVKGEKLGEFPARWELVAGSAEVTLSGRNSVIELARDGAIAPLMKQASYLPAAFTLEMDVLLVPNQRLLLYFYDQSKGPVPTALGELGSLTITERSIMMPDRKMGKELNEPGTYPAYDSPSGGPNNWHHLQLAFNQRSLKGYLDQNRLLNIPDVHGKPTGLTLVASPVYADTRPLLVRHVRLAAGGQELYARLMTDGRLVSHDILFDPGQAVIKPASQPALDQLAGLLRTQPALRFSIEGHTDSDGDAEANQALSEARAKAVRLALIKSGIAAERLTSKGWGETNPLDPSNTPAAKAQNRRVEFVKL